jgi:hypothetical protein
MVAAASSSWMVRAGAIPARQKAAATRKVIR